MLNLVQPTEPLLDLVHKLTDLDALFVVPSLTSDIQIQQVLRPSPTPLRACPKDILDFRGEQQRDLALDRIPQLDHLFV